MLLALVAIGVPSAARAVLGRPRLQIAATLASASGVVVAQVIGELARSPLAVVGDAQVGLALVASAFACVVVALVEGPHNPRKRTT